MENSTFKTKGMHCSSCEMLVKEALEELPGVSKVSLSHKTGIVDVDFDGSKVSKKKLADTIRNEGYEVSQ